MPEPLVAISVKQPWAALLVAGIKTVEIRSWTTRRRGRVLIHAGKIDDERPEGWERINTLELKELAALRGGIVGEGQLIACKGYATARAFAADAELHFNDPGWFKPKLCGFVFRGLKTVPFLPCPGQTLFFKVEDAVAAKLQERPTL